MARKHNAICNFCGESYYQRPYQKRKNKSGGYCSMKCFGTFKTKPNRTCETCGKEFHPPRKTSRYCSRRCSSGARKPCNGKYVGGTRDLRAYRLQRLFDVSGFDSCMVDGCGYNRTYDIHRLVCGKDGGKYEVGNMFAICPNHHAEFHRNIAVFEKVTDFRLRIVYKEA